MPTFVAARPIDFGILRLVPGGEAGARALFERLVGQLVLAVRPAAHQLQGSGGDWGIDVIVGELAAAGEAAVWQAKYYPDGIKPRQRREIEASIARVMLVAAKRGFRVAYWALVVPCRLTPAEKTWWDGFRRSQIKGADLTVELWDATTLEGLLYAPECSGLRRAYFNWDDRPVPIAVHDVPDDGRLDAALFVKQLEVAGITESASAKQQFFNAEVLVREVTDKAVAEEVDELRGRTAEVFALWETRYGTRAATASDDLHGLYGEVMTAIEAHHRSTPVRALRAALLHTLGFMHQHVDEARAGWIREWREVAQNHGR